MPGGAPRPRGFSRVGGRPGAGGGGGDRAHIHLFAASGVGGGGGGGWGGNEKACGPGKRGELVGGGPQWPTRAAGGGRAYTGEREGLCFLSGGWFCSGGGGGTFPFLAFYPPVFFYPLQKNDPPAPVGVTLGFFPFPKFTGDPHPPPNTCLVVPGGIFFYFFFFFLPPGPPPGEFVAFPFIEFFIYFRSGGTPRPKMLWVFWGPLYFYFYFTGRRGGGGGGGFFLSRGKGGGGKWVGGGGGGGIPPSFI
jgi:hypothetical protein